MNSATAAALLKDYQQFLVDNGERITWNRYQVVTDQWGGESTEIIGSTQLHAHIRKHKESLGPAKAAGYQGIHADFVAFLAHSNNLPGTTDMVVIRDTPCRVVKTNCDSSSVKDTWYLQKL